MTKTAAPFPYRPQLPPGWDYWVIGFACSMKRRQDSNPGAPSDEPDSRKPAVDESQAAPPAEKISADIVSIDSIISKHNIGTGQKIMLGFSHLSSARERSGQMLGIIWVCTIIRLFQNYGWPPKRCACVCVLRIVSRQTRWGTLRSKPEFSREFIIYNLLACPKITGQDFDQLDAELGQGIMDILLYEVIR